MTDNYRSPSTLARGSAPGMVSDVFTCGLMLVLLVALAAALYFLGRSLV